MTKLIPHVTLSVSAIMAAALTWLQTISTVAPSWEAWLGSVGIPAVIGIVTTIQQMAQGGVNFSSLLNLGQRLQALEQSFKTANLPLK